MLTRQIKCKKCGAPKDALDDAIVVLCDFCGAYVTIETDQFFEPETVEQRTREALRRALNPTKTEQRWTALAEQMQQTKEAGDRGAWRATAEEFYALQPLVDPSFIPEDRRAGQALRGWIKETIAVAELCNFDPELSAAEKRAADTLSGLYSGADPVETARAYLDARIECNRLLFDHPDYPQQMDRPDPAESARDTVRTALTGLGTMIPADAMRTIQVELLGATEAGADTTCANCGAPIDSTTIEGGQCPFCGGRVSVSAEDPQVEALLSSFAAVKASLQDDSLLAMTAINLALSPALMGGEPPAADTVFRYLQQAICHLPAGHIQQALGQLEHMKSVNPKLGELFDELSAKLGDWEQQPA